MLHLSNSFTDNFEYLWMEKIQINLGTEKKDFIRIVRETKLFSVGGIVSSSHRLLS
jgi:hypothetical protein